MITPSNAFDPQITSGGLSLNVQPGSLSQNGVITSVPQTAVALTANTTNYVYLDLATASVLVNTSGFPAYSCPIATVVTLTSSIKSVVDNRVDLDFTTGGSLSPAQTLNAAAQSSFRLIDSELTLGYQGTTSVSGSVAAVRGNTTIAAGDTVGGSSFVYGVQGKLTISGVMNSSSGWLTGILGQLDISAATLTAGNLSAGWFDAGASATATSAANLDIVRVTNSTGCKANSMLFMSGNATYGFYLDDQSSGWITGTTGSTAAGCVKVHSPAGVRYIQLFSSVA